MPFWLTNAPAFFQHFMNDIIRHILNQYIIGYLDDILVFSDNPEQHCCHVHSILERTWTEFLGYIFSPDGIKMNPQKVEAGCK